MLWKLLRAGRGEEAEQLRADRGDGRTAKAREPEDGEVGSCDGPCWEGREFVLEDGRKEEEGEEARGEA